MSVRNFDLNQKKESQDLNDPQQLNFSDLHFHLPQADFTDLPELSDDLWFSLKALSHQKVSKKYFSLSVMVHVLLAWILLFLNIPLTEKPKIETVTIEIKDISGNEAEKVVLQPIKPAKAPIAEAAPAPVAAPTPVAPAPTSAPAPAPAVAVVKIKPAPRATPKAVVAPRPSVAVKAAETETKENKIEEPVIKLKPATAGKSSASAKPQLLAEESDVSVPETLEDIPSPALDEESLNKTQISKPNVKLNKAIEKDLSQVDQQTEDLVAHESQQLNQATQNLEDEAQENVNAIEEQEKAEQEALAKANAHRRQQDAQAIAAAKAQEEANAKAAAAAAAAQAAALRGGNGSGDGEAEQTGAAPGVGEVRSLQQMRQMPGNPKPSYDYQERLRGDAGEVVFLAYVTREGATSQFKLMKSTGHRNLDLKTLKALKKWKFYPGQEGWVEFPFRWDLNGGPTEMPTLLRRKR